MSGGFSIAFDGRQLVLGNKPWPLDKDETLKKQIFGHSEVVDDLQHR